MTKVSTFASLACLTFVLACAHSDKPPRTVLDIINGKVPEVNLSSHKPYDIEVYRTTLQAGNLYLVTYYQKENDTLRSHAAGYGDSLIFNKVEYSWLSDTSVSIRLFSTVSNEEKSFIVSGYGSRSLIKQEE